MYVYMYVYMYVCMYTCMCIYGGAQGRGHAGLPSEGRAYLRGVKHRTLEHRHLARGVKFNVLFEHQVLSLYKRAGRRGGSGRAIRRCSYPFHRYPLLFYLTFDRPFGTAQRAFWTKHRQMGRTLSSPPQESALPRVVLFS